MPELPEIETIVAGLNRLVIGKIIDDITWDWAKAFPNDPAVVDATIGRSIVKASRMGKAILIDLDNTTTILIHLKMTGQLVFQEADQEGPFPDKTTRVTLDFTDGSLLFFNDQRKFGWVKILTSTELANNEFLQKLGPDPLSKTFTQALFTQRMSRRKDTSVKAALLDQTVVAGLGNIYCDEALFLAGIMPDRKVRTLSDQDYRKLHRAIRKVLKRSVELGGSTRRNYLNVEGIRGHYLDEAFVYGRTGEPCRVCAQPILKIRVAGRGTHFCKHCQK
ncbi:MAG: DNA-formamidopyrimidine glycosylase [Clostridiaceae bacterium]